MKTITCLLAAVLLAAAPFDSAEAATPATSTALPVLKVSLPLFGKTSVEKRNMAKRKQTLRRRKHLYHF